MAVDAAWHHQQSGGVDVLDTGSQSVRHGCDPAIDDADVAATRLGGSDDGSVADSLLEFHRRSMIRRVPVCAILVCEV
jgi:hypothetical protein